MAPTGSTSMEKPRTLIFPDLESLNRATAVAFAQAVKQAIQERNRFLVAISGGETPMELFSMLGGSPYRDYLPWQDIQVFWVDERCVAATDADSNYGNAWQHWLKQVTIPPANLHRIPVELAAADAVEAYEKDLRLFADPRSTWVAFDLVLLGLGVDGHTASLFPGSPVDTDGHALVSVVQPSQGRLARRISMTPLVINLAKQVIFMVSGASKQTALAASRNPSSDLLRWPARRIQPISGSLLWMVDQAAMGETDAGNE